MEKESIISKTLQKVRSLYYPWYTTIEVTQNCNFSCVHCYNFDRTKLKSNPSSDKAPLSDQEYRTLIQDVIDAGGLYISFTGGEPLMNKNIEDYIALVKENYKIPKLKSNLALLDKQRAKKLKECGLEEVDVSVYGMSDETYLKFTGGKGKFSQLTHSLDIASAYNFNISLNFILSNINVHEVPQMVALANQYNFRFNFSIEITKRYDGSDSSMDFSLSRGQLMELFSSDHAEYFTQLNPSENLQCSCAKSVCGINMFGDVYPCMGAPVYSGNIREQSFNDIWMHSEHFSKIRNLKSEDFSKCHSCGIKKYCQRSSGSIYSNTGNYTGADQQTCTIAEIRASIYQD